MHIDRLDSSKNRISSRESIFILLPHETADVAAASFQIENWSMAPLRQKNETIFFRTIKMLSRLISKRNSRSCGGFVSIWEFFDPEIGNWSSAQLGQEMKRYSPPALNNYLSVAKSACGATRLEPSPPTKPPQTIV